MTNVFLGGTCNNSTWRDKLISLLEKEKIAYFNPIVDDWKPEDVEKEKIAAATSDICLYTITPKMTGVYSIAEVVRDSFKKSSSTILLILKDDEGSSFSSGQLKSLDAVSKMVEEQGVSTVYSLEEAFNVIKEKLRKKSFNGFKGFIDDERDFSPKPIFFDTEFTGLKQNTTLISLGIVSWDNKTFYAEFNDYDRTNIEPWLIDNVIPKLLYPNKRMKNFFDRDEARHNVTMYDNSFNIATELKKWLDNLSPAKDSLEVWSDCLSYDWVLLNGLFGHAFNLPKNLYYIPFDICTLMKLKGIDPDINREQFCEYTGGLEAKHNSLHDAKIIKACYEKLMK